MDNMPYCLVLDRVSRCNVVVFSTLSEKLFVIHKLLHPDYNNPHDQNINHGITRME